MLALISFCLIGFALASEQIEQIEQKSYFSLPEEQWTEPETPEVGYLGLSSGASLVVPNIRTSFSCVGRAYGYFADVENNCQIYHICLPSRSPKGESVVYQYSNFCPNQTRFDQRQIVCLNLDNPNLLPCQESLGYYALTENRFREAPPQVQQREALEQIPVSEIEQKQEIGQEIEQRVEQIPIEEQRHEVLEPIPQVVKGSQTVVRSPVLVNREIPTKSIGRIEQQVLSQVSQLNEPVLRSVPLLQTIPQPIAQQSIQPAISLRSSPIQSVKSGPLVQSRKTLVQNSPQLLSSQAVIPQSGLVQPIVSHSVEQVFPPRDGRKVESRTSQLLRPSGLAQPNLPIRNTESLQTGYKVIPTVTRTSGLVGPAVSLRNSQILQNRPIVSQINSQLISPLVRSVPLVQNAQLPVAHQSVQPIVPLRSVQPIGSVVQEGLTDSVVPLGKSEVLLSQTQPLISQSLLSQPLLSQPLLSQPLLSQPLLSQPLLSQPLISQPLLSQPLRNSQLLQNKQIVSQPLHNLRRVNPLVSPSNVVLRSDEQVVSQPNLHLNPIPQLVGAQSVVPLQRSQLVEGVAGPLLSQYNLHESQLAGIPLQQVEPQIGRTQSVVPQIPLSNPVLSQYNSGLGVIKTQNLRAVNNNVVPNSVGINQQNGGVIRPAQNPNFVNL